ncbi:pyridoxamine 5'-phosphate oxidase family protein [Maribacter aestuarii]|uniref:pyridoxamine 5'-phosphate oxidase family protein n=1 Tax=Maribacter aestuarii TaxID=1130723 RepID=UPI00248C8C20|nr:pyridoxamine 5'-phosphate oxidase family protein [Maribacter aestuarii]
MRRNLKEKECKELLSNNYIGYLGYISGSYPHVVPITYHYDEATHTITSYSSEGHKIDAMRKNPLVSLCVDEISSVANWESVLVHGTFTELTGIDAKHMLRQFSEGVKNIINRAPEKNAQFISEFSAKIEKEKQPLVFRINIEEITGKKRES